MDEWSAEEALLRELGVEDDGEFDFVDKTFPPRTSSLFDPTMPRHREADAWQDFTWKRAKDVYGRDQVALFRDIKPGDIEQGYCGDCYFLSCLSSLAEFPDRIRTLFVTKETNSSGIYAVQLYITGERRVVVVDDYFPYCKYRQDFAMSTSKDRELWVLILEKAWAKVHGSYQRIEGGNTSEALYALTGVHVDTIFHE